MKCRLCLGPISASRISSAVLGPEMHEGSCLPNTGKLDGLSGPPLTGLASDPGRRVVSTRGRPDRSSAVARSRRTDLTGTALWSEVLVAPSESIYFATLVRQQYRDGSRLHPHRYGLISNVF